MIAKALRRLLPVLLAVALAPPAAAQDASRPVVTASIGPLAFLVDRLTADRCEVRVLLPPGAEVESYEPRPAELRDLARSRIVVLVGHPAFALEHATLEPYLARRPQIRRLALIDRLSPAERSALGTTDPHPWISLRLLGRLVEPLATVLAAELPSEASAIAARASQLGSELVALDDELGLRLAAKRGKSFLIHHPALGPLAGDYGLRQRALEVDGKDPSAAALGRLLGDARRGGAAAILVHRGESPRVARSAARELGAKLIEIDPLARDWPAALRAIGAALDEALW